MVASSAKASFAGLAEIYKSLNPQQLALYHSIPLSEALKLHAAMEAGRQYGVDPDKIFLETWAYGGVGSGKTFGVAYKALTSSVCYPDNMILVVRKRHEQLRNTFLKELYKIADLATNGQSKLLILDDKEKDGAVELVVATAGRPSLIVCRIEPDGSDHDIQESWKGYTAGGAILEEMSQLRQVTRTTIRTRIRKTGVPLWMVATLNPVNNRHWAHKIKAEALTALYNGQRPGVLIIESKTSDNKKNLPPNYEEQIREMYKDEPHKIAAMLEGKDDVDLAGKPVFGYQFKDSIHVDASLRGNPFKPVIRGWDFGFHHPACVWMQEDDKGNLNVLAELLGDNETAEQFAERVQVESQKMFPEYNFTDNAWDFGDPACLQATDKGDTTWLRLMKMGIRIQARPSSIDAGLKVIRNSLTRLRGGRPELVFHPRCQDLINGMRFGYHYKVYSNGQPGNKPNKDGYFDHLMDAFRYAMIHIRVLPQEEGVDASWNQAIVLPPTEKFRLD